jgi:hypothetical protein
MIKPTSTVTSKPDRSPRPWAIALAGALVLTGGAVAAVAAKRAALLRRRQEDEVVGRRPRENPREMKRETGWGSGASCGWPSAFKSPSVFARSSPSR